jgi:ATP-dependent helicase/DNAse subunit B
MFQVTTGSFLALEEAFVADLLAARKKDPLTSLLVLSPSGRLLTHLQTRLAGQSAGFLNIQFLTFYALAERLLSNSNYTEQVITEPAVYHEMIREVLTGTSPEPIDLLIRKDLKTDGKPISRGLAGALAATMKDMRDAGMRADLALKAARDGFLGKEAPEAASTLALYGRLVGLFEKHHLRSSADLLRRAAGEAPKNPWLRQQKTIFLYGFYDLTGVQLDLVLSLADHPDARIYFPHEEGNPAYAYGEKLLKDSAFVSKSRPEARGPRAEAKNSSEVRGPRSEILPGPQPSALGPSVEVWSCSGARDEVWLAAKEILRRTDEGISFDEIAVISRNLSPYLRPLRDVFNAHEIPYNSARKEPAGAHPLVKTIRALLTFDEKYPSAKTLKEDLEKSHYMVRDTKTDNGRDTNGSPSYHATLNDSRTTYHAHITWAVSLIQRSIALPQNATDEERALLEAVLASLEELKILDHLGSKITREHFLETWQEKVEKLERPDSGPSHAGVQVLEVQQARGLSFKVVFLLGMNEKVFPRLIREDPFLSDAARSALAQATGCRLGRKMDGYEEERFLFELMRQSATQHLYLLTERSDEEGKALIPSTYLKELEHSIPGLEPIRLPRATADKFEKRSPLTWTPKELSFLLNRADLKLPDLKKYYTALGWDIASFDHLLTVHRAIESFRTGLAGYDGVLEDVGLVKSTLEKGFSPTSLESLAQCPFQYYAGHVLKIPVEENLAPEGEMTPQALGQLFHKTLELFYTGCRHKGIPKTDKELAVRLREAAESSFSEFTARLSTVYPLALRISKDIVIKELSSFLKDDIEECAASGYSPRWFEQPMDGTMASGTLPYSFHGKLDRVDTKEGLGITEVRVIDYKSGKPKAWIGRIETQIIQGRLLQLPIYLALAGPFAEKELGKKARVTTATLRPVRESDEEPMPPLTADFWESPSAKLFIENMRELIGIIEKEKFYIEPDTREMGYCSRCDFARICRKEHMPTRLRAERDPLRQRVSEKLARTAPAAEKKEKAGKKGA